MQSAYWLAVSNGGILCLYALLNVEELFLQHSSKELRVCIDIYDEVGIGGGASGVSGGLLHPYSPKGSHHIFLN